MAKRSKFNLSAYKKFTAKMGILYPVAWWDITPGTTVRHAAAGVLRFLPMLAPVMHPIQMRVYHFFVPYRLILDGWEEFITGGKDGLDATELPFVDINEEVVKSSLHDYLGVPPFNYTGQNRKLLAFPYRCYYRIVDDWFKDQDIQPMLDAPTTPGLDSTNYQLQRVCWEKDYFTTARLTESKGPSVTIPINVQPTGDMKPEFNDGTTTRKLRNAPGGQFVASSPAMNDSNEWTWSDPKLAAAGLTVNDLRLSLAIQRYQEARQQFGSRYVEYLRYLGIRSSDARLQNAEFCGSHKTMVRTSEILQTAADGTNPVGTLRGHGITGLMGRPYRRFFEEHGMLMSVMSVVPKAVYTQAMNRAWFKTVKEEFFQRELAFLGDQQLTNKEVYFPHTNPDSVFGYIPRYDEYRTTHSSVAGDFHDTLNFWHLGRIHAGDVALNPSFIECNPSDRIFATQGGDTMQITLAQRIVARAMIPKNPKPRTF